MDLINSIFAAFLEVLQGTLPTMLGYAVPILGAMAIIAWYYQGGLDLAMSGGGNLGEVLGSLVSRLVGLGIYMWVLLNWEDLTQAIWETLMFFATIGAAGSDLADLFHEPGGIWELGLKVAKPFLDFDTWAAAIGTLWNIVVGKMDFWVSLAILASFAVMTLSFGMVLIEFHLALLVGAVMLPWSILRPLGDLGQFAVGWLTGAGIRALTMGLLMGIAFPLFDLLRLPDAPAPGGFVDRLYNMVVPATVPTLADTFTLVAASLLFLLLCVLLPGRAARLAGHGLALTGSDVMAGAATGARFAMLGMGVVRGTSRMLARL